MKISADDAEGILSCQRSDPQIIFGDRSPLLPELVTNSRVVSRSVQIDRKDDRTRDHEVKTASEALLLARPHQTVSIFTNHNGRKMMLLFERENFCNRLIAAQER